MELLAVPLRGSRAENEIVPVWDDGWAFAVLRRRRVGGLDGLEGLDVIPPRVGGAVPVVTGPTGT